MNLEQMPRKAAMFSLTAGMGAGKTTAGEELTRLGAEVIDSDQTMRELRKPGQAGFVAIVGILGEDVLADNGTIDTKKMSAAIFSDLDLKQEIEQATHPLVWTNMYEQVATLDEEDIAVLEVPLLTPETASVFDGVVAINTDPELAIERLVNGGRKITREEAEVRIATQMTNEQRTAMAHHLIENNAGIEEYMTSIRGAWGWIQEVAAERLAAAQATPQS